MFLGESVRKKICHVTSVHHRYDTRIFQKECKSLAEHGYDVFLVVNDDLSDEIIEGVHILSTGINPKNRLDRIFNSTERLGNLALKLKADLYHFHDIEMLFLAKKLKKKGYLVVFDVHEDAAVEILEKKWIPKPLRKLVSCGYQIIEKRILPKMDALITVTPYMVQKLKTLNSTVRMITNYPIISQEDTVINKPKKIITYLGTIEPTWYLEKVIRAISDYQDVRLILAGRTNESYLEKLKTEPGWEKVDYLGFINKKKVEEIYSETAIGIATNYSTQLALAGGTLGNNKLFEIMYSRIPLICTDYPLWKEIVDRYYCGLTVDPRSQEQVSQAIETLLKNPELAKQMGENGHRAVLEEYNWNTQKKTLLNLYSELLSKNELDSLSDNPLVTVILPAYNHEEYIRDSLSSVFRQTYTKLQVLVFDDGSRDQTPIIIQDTIKEYKDFAGEVIFISKTNEGLANTLNRGLAASKGELVAIIASDDEWLPDKIEKCVEFMKTHQDCGMVFSDAYFLRNKEKTTHRFTEYKERIRKTYPTTGQKNIYDVLLRENIVPAPTAVVRKEIYDKIGGFDSELRYEDLDMWLRIAKHFLVGFIDEPLVYYRTHDKNFSNNTMRMIHGAVQTIVKQYQEKPLKGKLLTQLYIITRFFIIALGNRVRKFAFKRGKNV